MKNTLKLMVLVSLLASGLNASAFGKFEDGNSVNGAQIWADACIRCPNQREPSALRKRTWKYSMQHMRIRAGLTGQETRDIFKFIFESKRQKMPSK